MNRAREMGCVPHLGIARETGSGSGCCWRISGLSQRCHWRPYDRDRLAGQRFLPWRPSVGRWRRIVLAQGQTVLASARSAASTGPLSLPWKGTSKTSVAPSKSRFGHRRPISQARGGAWSGSCFRSALGYRFGSARCPTIRILHGRPLRCAAGALRGSGRRADPRPC